MRDRVFHYVPFHSLPDWLRCGWIARAGLNGIHHGEYSALCEWLCSCKMARPR